MLDATLEDVLDLRQAEAHAGAVTVFLGDELASLLDSPVIRSRRRLAALLPATLPPDWSCSVPNSAGGDLLTLAGRGVRAIPRPTDPLRLLAELAPGKAKKDITALQAKAILASVRPRDVLGKTRCRLAAVQLADLVAVEKKIKLLSKVLKATVQASASTFPELPGGPSRHQRPALPLPEPGTRRYNALSDPGRPRPGSPSGPRTSGPSK